MKRRSGFENASAAHEARDTMGCARAGAFVPDIGDRGEWDRGAPQPAAVFGRRQFVEDEGSEVGCLRTSETDLTTEQPQLKITEG